MSSYTLSAGLWVASLAVELARGTERPSGTLFGTAQFEANPLGLWVRDAVLQQLASEFAAGVNH